MRCPDLMLTRQIIWIFLLFLVGSSNLRADDFYWTNLLTGNVTNSGNWVTNGLGVTTFPTANDNVYFTNDGISIPTWNVNLTNANMYVNPNSGSITQNITSGTTLWITNNYIIGQTAGQTGAVRLTSTGTLVVTNGNGTGTLWIGQAGKGTLTMTDGTLIVDYLFATNVSPSATNSFFTFGAGTLTTQKGSFIIASNAYSIGSTAGRTSVWNVVGGTNVLIQPNNTGAGHQLNFGTTSGKAIVNVTGAGTVWSNIGSAYIGSSSSTGNRLTVSNGARGHITATVYYQTANNVIAVSDTNSLLKFSSVFLGYFSGSNRLVVSNGANFISSSIFLGYENSGANNALVVTGPGSLWTNSGFLMIGYASSGSANGNSLTVSDGGKVQTTFGNIGESNSTGNSATVIGNGSIWTNTGALSLGVSNGSTGNSLMISNGGSVYNTVGSIGLNGALNTARVSDTNSLWRNTILYVGFASRNNQLIISNGASVISSTGYVGNSAAASNNTAIVTGAGSTWSNTLRFIVGQSGQANQLIITNGGTVFATNGVVGGAASGQGSITLSGTNSLLKLFSLHLGTNSVSSGTGSLFMNDGAVLEGTNFVTGFNNSGAITNQGGILQFFTSTPTLVTNTVDSIILTNATLSYRNVSNADIFNTQVSNISFQGNNTFRLNNSTNSSITSYTFGTNNGNLYQHLTLYNNATRWQSTAFTMGSGGILSISNTTATVSGVFTNSGTINVFNSRVTYESPVIIHGAYLSDPSTNIFTTNVTITSSGYIQAAAGDFFQFERDLTLQSTQSNLFNMSSAIVLFTNLGGAHLLDLTGSSALDRGTNGIVTLTDVTNNFAIGTLQLFGAGDTLRVTGAVVNALYVGTLDLGALANTNNLFTDVNVYYDANLPANAYLARSIYDLQGNGMLIPYGVPEPGFVSIVASAVLALILRKRTLNSILQSRGS